MDSTSHLPLLPPRPADSHKGDFGHVLIIGGSGGLAGAAALAGMAALRGGAGLVSLLVPLPCAALVASFEPSYMVHAAPADVEGRFQAAQPAVEQLIERATSVAIGPGLGLTAHTQALVQWLYASLPLPLVIDADGLNALAGRPLPAAAGPRLLTPHPGEFRRLCPDAPRERAGMEDAAVQWAGEHELVLVLKGHHTLVTDGSSRWHNTTGNPGMATGGCGDSLTGLLTALRAQHLSAWDAARLATHVHGLAGDLAAEQLGEVSLIASDLIRFLPAALRHVHSTAAPPGGSR